MSSTASSRLEPAGTARIHPDVILDGRLAIYHETGGWLAVADLHYGYEVALRDAGGLFPLWGMQRIEDRLADLCAEYQPQTVIVVGDVVHSGRNVPEAARLAESLRGLAEEVIFIEGNHDRGPIRKALEFQKSVSRNGFFLHHGHLDLEGKGEDIIVTGHEHPAISFRDGAGTSLKLPALLQERDPDGRERWILPAFSPWAGGYSRRGMKEHTPIRRWLCSPKRVFAC